MSAEGTQREGADPGRDAREMEKKVAEVARFALPIGTLSLATLGGMVLGPPGAVLILAGGALVGVIVVFWSSVRTLFGETALSGADAYALGAPRVEEEQKRAVLRALKDLEFERSVGKISDEDYQGLVLKYRAEAKRLLRLLDEEAQPRRDQVEGLLQQRLRREGLAPASEGEAADAKGADKGKKRKRVRAEADADRAPAGEASVEAKVEAKAPEPDPEPEADAATRACAACRTINDADAVFCKKCGARRAAAEAKDDVPASKGEPAASGDDEGAA
jgi:hypothetical protein